MNPLSEEIQSLKAEVAALTQALEKIAVHDGGRWLYLEDSIERQTSMQKIAKAALASTAPAEEEPAATLYRIADRAKAEGWTIEQLKERMFTAPQQPATDETVCPCVDYNSEGTCKPCTDHPIEDPGGRRPDEGHYGAGEHCSFCETPGCDGSGTLTPVTKESHD